MIERIEQRRIERNMTVKQLSTISGIPEATYSNILKGRSKNPSFETVRSLALAVEMSLDEVISSIGDGEPSSIPEDLQTINQAPATTQELDSAMSILMRIMTDNNTSYQAALQSRNEEFERALIARDEQFAKSLESKDAQFERERESLLETIHNKDRWIRWEFALVCMLITFICIVLLIDVLHPDIGWIRRTFMDMFSMNNLA